MTRTGAFLVAHWRSLGAGLICLLGTVCFGVVVNEHYAVSTWLSWQLGKLVALTLLLNAAALGAGHALLTRVLRIRSLPLVETCLFSFALGLICITWAIYLAGALGLIGSTFAVVMPLVFAALGAPLARRCGSALKRVRRQTTTGNHRLFVLALGAWGVANVGLMYLQVLTPDAINFDASWYHLPIAQDYAREGRIVPFYSDYNRTHPHLTSLIHTWGFAWPKLEPQLRWVLALHVEFSVVLWKIVGVVCVARWLLGARSAARLWPVFFAFPAIAIYDQNIGGSADHFLGVFAAPAFLATMRAIVRFSPRRCALTGVVLAGAMLTKMQAVYIVTACSALLVAGGVRTLLVKDPSLVRRALHAAWIVPAVFLLVSAPHFVKNALFHHNPIYPFAQSWFPTYPSHERTALLFEHGFAETQHLPPAELWPRLVNALQLFWTYSFETHYSFHKGFPSAGSLFTLILPCVFLVKQRGRILWGIGVCAVALLTWAGTYVVDRYTQAFATLPIAVAAALLVQVAELGRVARLGAALLLLSQLVWAGDAWFYSGHRRLVAASDLIRSGYEGKSSVEQRFPQRSEQLAITRATPQNAVIVARNYRTTLGIDRTLLSDIPGFQSYLYYDPLRSPTELYELYASRDVTHLLYPVGQRPLPTLQANVLFAGLVAGHTKEQRRKFGGLELVDLAKPPASAIPYDVLVVGQSGYADGRYHVEQLGIDPRVPRELQPPALPLRSVSDESGQPAPLRGVQAVVLGAQARLPAPLQAALNRDFGQVERFAGFSIWVRKT